MCVCLFILSGFNFSEHIPVVLPFRQDPTLKICSLPFLAGIFPALHPDLVSRPWSDLWTYVTELLEVAWSWSPRSCLRLDTIPRTSIIVWSMVNPRPKDNPPPEYPRMLGWTANGASTNHFKITLPLALRISGRVRMPLMYLIMWTILAQSSCSGAQNIIVRNVTTVQVSSLAHLVAYKVFPPGCETVQSYSVGDSRNLLTYWIYYLVMHLSLCRPPWFPPCQNM